MKGWRLTWRFFNGLRDGGDWTWGVEPPEGTYRASTLLGAVYLDGAIPDEEELVLVAGPFLLVIAKRVRA